MYLIIIIQYKYWKSRRGEEERKEKNLSHGDGSESPQRKLTNSKVSDFFSAFILPRSFFVSLSLSFLVVFIIIIIERERETLLEIAQREKIHG